MSKLIWSGTMIHPDGPHAWLWPGLLAPGHVTLLSGPQRSGKSTVLAHLLAARHTGGCLFDRPVAAGTSFVATNETIWAWRARSRTLVFGPSVGLTFRSGADVVDGAALIDRLLALRAERGLDLVVLDPPDVFLPTGASLRALTDAGLAVLLLQRDPNNAELAVAMADIQLALQPALKPFDRCRELHAHAGYVETPDRLRFALSADDTTLALVHEPASSLPHWPTVRQILAAAAQPLTAAEIHARWPADAPRPHPVTLWRCLRAAQARRLIRGERGEQWGGARRYTLACGG